MINTRVIEKKWQKRWEEEGVFTAKNNSDKKKYYILVEFPYPSGAGLHVGHVRSYTALDAMARLKRAQGYNVLYPIGWDAFGAPAEQYAIKNHVYPSKMVSECIDNFKHQIKALGISFDWSREINTSSPEYYKWTQWQFLQFYKAGLAYKAEKDINWCPNCKMGLSNEDAAGGVCERCGSKVEKKLKNQWMLKMTAYADSLIEGLKAGTRQEVVSYCFDTVVDNLIPWSPLIRNIGNVLCGNYENRNEGAKKIYYATENFTNKRKIKKYIEFFNDM